MDCIRADLADSVLCVSRYTDEAHYFELTGGQYREIQPAKPGLWLPKAGVGMGLWFGTYQGLERQWLRCYDAVEPGA